jgi:hypothetical protein
MTDIDLSKYCQVGISDFSKFLYNISDNTQQSVTDNTFANRTIISDTVVCIKMCDSPDVSRYYVHTDYIKYISEEYHE